jgi:ankyrin repeat protein
MLALEHGHLDVCKYLLNGGADPNFPAVPEGESILHKAIQRDDVEVVELLLKQDEIAIGVSVQSLPAPGLRAGKGHSLSLFKVTKPRHKRINLGHETQQDQIRMAHMVSREDKTNMCISQSFIDTLSKTSDNMLRLLIPLDWPDESSQTGSWCTLLHVACRRGHIRLARRLISLDRGHECDRHDHTGRTPLAFAADTGSIDLVSKFLQSGRVKITRLSTPEESVLANCARYNNRITERLLEADPSLITLSDINDRTLLHHALNAGNNELIRYLIIHTDVDVNTLLQRHLSYELLSRYIEPASLTPLRMALELGSEARDRYLSAEAGNESGWKAESFELISEALLASNKVDISNLECREELQYLALAAKLRSKSLTWSLVEKGLLSSWKGPHRKEEHVAGLMFVLREDIELLMGAATKKSLLSDTLNILVGTLTNGKRRGGFLTLIRSDFRVAKEIFMCGSIAADRNAQEENRLALEEAVRRNENDLVREMIHRGFGCKQ